MTNRGNVPLSTLRCEPNHIDRTQLREYHGPPGGYIFWKVYVNDRQIADLAQPFTARDPILELRGEPEVPIWGDGWEYVSVRQIGNYVIWCTLLEGSVDVYDEGLASGEIIIFSKTAYTATLDNMGLPSRFQQAENAGMSRRFSQNLYYPPFANPSTDLPYLSSHELETLLQPTMPSDDAPLYRIPETDSDRRGVHLLQHIKSALNVVTADLTAVPTPDTWLEVEIGLDIPQPVECKWLVAKIQNGYAIFFESMPYFPLWITSTALNDVLHDEFFVAS